MPEAATEFGKIKDHVRSIAHDMEATQSASKQTSDALGSLLKTLVVVDVTLRGLEKASIFSPMARNLKEAFTTLGKTQDQLRAIHYLQLNEAQEEFKAGKMTEAQLERIENITRSRLPLLNAQLKLEQEINKVGALRFGILAATATAMGRLFYISQDFNESAIKANADWRSRRDLFYTNLQIQRETGVAFRSVADAQRELVNYGFQTRQDYTDVLKTAVMLHEGLGMSVHAAIDLAVVTERQVKVSFKSTVDVVAQLVDQTSLAADEVERIAKTLGPLILAIQPRGAPAFPQIVQALAQYEDAIKRLGGMGDEFTQMIAKMLTPEGILQAGILGIRDPGQLLKATGIQQAMDAFNRYADQMLAGSAEGSMERAQRMQALADMFGTTYVQMSLMVDAAKNANAQLNGRITLEERFHKQMQTAGEGIKRIYSSVTALLERALYPAIVGINLLTNFIANMLQTILKYKPVAIAAAVAVDIAIVMTMLKLRSAAKAFYEVVLAAQIAAISLKNYAKEQMAQAAVSNLTKGAGGLKQVEQRVIPNLVQGDLFAPKTLKQGEFALEIEKKLAPSIGQQFSKALSNFGPTIKTGWATALEKYGIGLGAVLKQAWSGSTRLLVDAIKGNWASVGSGLMSIFNFLKGGALMARLLSLGGYIVTGFTWVLETVAAILAAPLAVIALTIAGVAVLLSLWAKKHAQSLEKQMAFHAAMVSTNRRVEDSVKTQIYMATRAGDQAKAQELMTRMVTMIRERKGSFQTLTKQEAAVEAAKFTDQLKQVVGLAQYTGTQFGKLKVTPAEREAQNKENLEFQQKIADNTKRSLEEARKAIDEEKRQAEAEQQARELRYLRDGGAVGRYSWA